MRLNYAGKEIPAYYDIDSIVLSGLIYSVFHRGYDFPNNISCITMEVIPYYCKSPRTLQEYLNELCLRGKLKRGSWIIECGL